MNRLKIPPLAVLCLLPSACGVFGGLSSEEQKRLTMFQQNAATYYGGQRFDQAIDAAEKGLELEPGNYKLLSVAGWSYLQKGEIGRADQFFSRAYAERSPADHGGPVLLGYGRTQQLLGDEHARLAETETARSERRDVTETERTLAVSRAEEHAARARAHWTEAERLYHELIRREELLRFAHKGLMEIDVQRGDYEKAVAEGQACLDRNLAEQEVKNSIIRETMNLDYERQERQALQDLVDQEIKVRSALAEMHFRKGNYEAAVKQLDVLLQLDPTRSTDYYNRGRALEELGRRDEARRDFEKFLGTTKLPNGDERVAHAYQYIKPGE